MNQERCAHKKVEDKELETKAPCPMLTVVVPVYNREKIVGPTLDSLAAQTLRPLRIILVDNNSTDGTLAVLQHWKDVNESADFQIDILREETPGGAAARNRGLREVASPYTLFFDSDDLMAPQHCRRVVDAFKAHPDADIIGWNVTMGRNTHIFSSNDVHWANLHYGTMATQRYAAPTELFRYVGGWRADCLGWDDTELGERLLFAAKKIIKLAGKPTVEVIFTPESITGASFSSGAQKWEKALDIIEDNYRTHLYKDAPQLRKLLRALNLRRAILAGDYRREQSVATAKQLLQKTIAKEPDARYRLIYRFAYRWRSGRLPGAARLLRPLF